MLLFLPESLADIVVRADGRHSPSLLSVSKGGHWDRGTISSVREHFEEPFLQSAST